MKQKRQRICLACNGEKNILVFKTEAEHATDCSGNCVNCKIPVDVNYSVPCEVCRGFGKVTTSRLREYIIDTYYPLEACELIDRLNAHLKKKPKQER